MTTMQHRLPEIGREIRKSVLSSKLSTLLLRGWAVLAALGYGLLNLSPPIAGRYWLLLLLIGIGFSFVLSAVWLQKASKSQQLAIKPWLLHWCCLIVVLALQTFHSAQIQADAVFSAQGLAGQCLLLASLGLMTAGLYLRSALLPAGLALAACYLYMITIGAWSGVITGAVCAAFLWSLSNEPAS